MSNVSPARRRRLEIQGFVGIDDQALTEIASWLRLAFSIFTVMAGTVLASPGILFTLVPIAALGALLPVHPFDLIYNYGIHRITKTRPLPRRGAPNRFACGLGAVWFVSTIDFCIPSLIYRTIFGFPPKSGAIKANFVPTPDMKKRQI